jgi:SAM-dependent methyltransferase
MMYDLNYTLTFHSPGIEPWVLGLLKQVRPRSVLDVGCGLGLWGLILRGYLGVSRIVGVDIDSDKVEFARKLGVYDEVYVSDVRAFDYADSFDAIIAIESIHGIIDLELLRRLEGLVKEGGIIVLALPSLPQPIRMNELVKMGYAVFRYFLRGFVLVRVNKPEVYTIPNRSWEVLGAFIKTLHPVFRLTRLLRRGYLIAYKIV